MGQEAPESRFYDLDDAGLYDRPDPTAVLWAVSGRVEKGKKQAGIMGKYAFYLQNDGTWFYGDVAQVVGLWLQKTRGNHPTKHFLTS